MAIWKKEKIQLENGQEVEAQVPEIISASRSTDIPAFYADWFFHRLKVGYSAWKNPFNGSKLYVSYKNTHFIVFWSKNPRPLLPYLDYLKEKGIGCYIQYSLNDYEKERLETGVPPLDERIDTFQKLVEKLGNGGVIWRFDPLMLTDVIDIDFLLKKIENIGDRLQGYTEKMVFSFADILPYRKVQINLKKENIIYREWKLKEMSEFAERLAELNRKKWNYTLATCGEGTDFEQFGIQHNRCIDDELIIKLAYRDKVLMDFLKVELKSSLERDLFGNIENIPKDAIRLPDGKYVTRGKNKDTGQREYCGCIKSKDIGEYNTCIHGCAYCYANMSKKVAKDNYEHHKQNPDSEFITGDKK